MKNQIKAILFASLSFIVQPAAFSQTQNENAYDWSNSSPDGNWQGSGERWWNPGGWYDQGPTANRKLRFNNNNQTTTQNNVFNGFNIYQLIFDAGSTSNRTVNGYSIVLNPDYTLSNTVKVENYSSATHTINLDISRGAGSGDMQLNPVNGNLIFNNTIDNGGKTINVWGNNSKYDEFNNVIQGSGDLNIRQYSIVKFNANNTYTGNTAIYQGELWIMANGGISSSSSIWLGNGCCTSLVTKLFLADGDGGQNFSNQINFNYGDAGNQILGGLNTSGTNVFSGNNISISSGKTLTIEQVYSGGTLEFSNGISGSGSMKFIGSGTTLFTGANSYTGLTTVNGGTLRLNRTGGTTIPVTNNVTVSSGTLRISSDQSLNDLSISSGATLTIDAGVTLTINGIFTGGGSIVNNGTMILKGNSSFPGSGSTITAMNNLSIDRSAGVTLDKNMAVTGTLTFVAGKLSIGNFDLTLSGAISGASGTQYISTNGTGLVKNNIANSASFVFPVGNSTYNPITITNNTGSSDIFSVKLFDEVYADGSSSGTTVITPRVRRTWEIAKATPSANAGNGVDLNFNWDPSTQTSATLTIPKLFHYETSSWIKKSLTGNTTYNVSAGTLQFTGYKGTFSPFSIMDDGQTLPLTWLSFTAKQVHDLVQLDWSTASEINNSHYEIQRSSDGLHFNLIGRIDATLNPVATNHYQYSDRSPISGTVYYRLKQIDIDGKFSYSTVIRINGAAYNDLRAFVSGAGILQVIIPASSSAVSSMNLYDASGRLTIRKQILPGRNDIDISQTGAGIYFIQIISGNAAVYSTRVIK